MDKKHKELIKRIEGLEVRIKELEARPPREIIKETTIIKEYPDFDTTITYPPVRYQWSTVPCFRPQEVWTSSDPNVLTFGGGLSNI